MPQTWLATKVKRYGVNLHPSAIAKIEARDVHSPRTIRLNEAVALAKAFGLSVDEMLQDDVTSWSLAADVAEAAVVLADRAAEELGRAIDLANKASFPQSDAAASARERLLSALVDFLAISRPEAHLTETWLTKLKEAGTSDGEHSEAP